MNFCEKKVNCKAEVSKPRGENETTRGLSVVLRLATWTYSRLIRSESCESFLGVKAIVDGALTTRFSPILNLNVITYISTCYAYTVFSHDNSVPGYARESTTQF